MMMKRKWVAVIAVMLAAALCLCGCGKTKETVSTATDATVSDATVTDATVTDATATDATDTDAEEPIIAQRIGEGEKQFMLTVTFKDGKMKAYNVSTDEDTVGAALSALGLIEGEQGDYGLNVITIDGERADYNEDGAYWAFYVNGAYAQTGVDGTEITEDSSYHFTYTPAA